jgi:hypothetical protein
MNTEAIESLTRRAADAVSRRASLVTLGGAALAAAVATKPGVSEAKKGGQSCGKKQKKKCKNVEATCNTNGIALCAGDPTCLSQIQLCCQQCFSDGFLQCLASLAG